MTTRISHRGPLSLLFGASLLAIPFGAPVRAQSTDAAVIRPAIGQEYINSIALSPDGKWIASGGNDHAVAIWDLDSVAIVKRFEGHTSLVRGVAISPDGRRIASVGGNRVKVWDIAAGRIAHDLGDNYKDAVAFSPDGRLIATTEHTLSTAPVVVIVDAARGERLRTLSGHDRSSTGINAVAFSGDGRLLASAGHDKTIRLWDVNSGRLVRTLRGHRTDVKTVAISPDGRWIVSGGDSDKTVRLWDAASGTLGRVLDGHSDDITSVAFSPDGRTFASAHYGEIRLWDTGTGRLLWNFAHENSGSELKFSADGRWLASGTLQHKILILDASTGRLARTLMQKTDALTPVAFSPDGSWLASGGRILRRWDTATGRLLDPFDKKIEYPWSLAISPDGKRMVAGKTILDISNGKVLKTLEGLDVNTFGSGFMFSRDGRWFSSAEDKTLRIRDATDGRVLKTLPGNKDAIYGTAISADGRLLAAGYHDSIRIWDAGSGRQLKAVTCPERCRPGAGGGRLCEKCSGNDSLAFSPDGHWLAAGGGSMGFHATGKHRTFGWGNIRLWDVASGRLIRDIDDFPSSVKTLAISPDGRQLVAATDDNKIAIWDPAAGRMIRPLHGHSSPVKSLAYSPDGKRIAGGSDSEIKIWQAETGEVLATLIASEADWVAITSEGFFDASENGAKLLYVVRGFEVTSIDQVYQSLYRPDLVREKLAGDPRGKVKEAAAKLDLGKVMASGAAPKVAILTPARNSTVPDDTVTVEAAIDDQGGGIGRVEWRVNGITLGLGSRGLARADGPSAPPATRQVVSQTVALGAGDNTVEVVAYNAKGLIASLPASVTVVAPATGPTAAVRLHVVAVGINDYFDSRLQLHFAVSDAKALGEALRRAGKSLYQSVTVTTVLDREATAAHLDKVFADLAAKVRPQDVFVFFLAGHGKTVDGRFYYIPQDFRYAGEDSIAAAGIGQDRLQDWFARIPAKKSMLLFDTCESGSLADERVALRGIERVAALDRLTRAMGRTVLTATTDDAPALEGYRGHGVFTYSLLEGLDAADANGDGTIEVTELAGFVDRRVPELSFAAFKRRQVPQMKILGSNFPLASRIAALAPAADAGTAPLPSKPTHVAVAPTMVREKPDSDAAAIVQLAPGTQVYLVESAGGWVLIARDGRRFGYVEEKALLRLQ